MNKYEINGQLVLSEIPIEGEKILEKEIKHYERQFICVMNDSVIDRVVYPIEFKDEISLKDSLDSIVLKKSEGFDRESYVVNVNNPRWKDALKGGKKKKYKLNLLGLGDVGSNLLIGLRLLGGDIISEIGIYDLDENKERRWEFELKQIYYFDENFPKVKIIEEEELFDCDIFVFCASRYVPEVGSENGDVRMAQYNLNSQILEGIGRKARNAKFDGIFALVSDPVDHLCKFLYYSSNMENNNFDYKGLMPQQIRGYGLGVMNARANYYSEELAIENFKENGRVFGPHGNGLICVDDIYNYDDNISRKLTELTVKANLKLREIGYKPYVAPAISSGCLSIIKTLRGDWHYSAVKLGDCYFGIKNMYTPWGDKFEKYKLDKKLYDKLTNTYKGLIDFEWRNSSI